MNTMSSCTGLVTARTQRSHGLLRVYPSTDVKVNKTKTTPRNGITNSITDRKHRTVIIHPRVQSNIGEENNEITLDSSESRKGDLTRRINIKEKQKIQTADESDRHKSHVTQRDISRMELVTRCQDWLKGLPDKFSGLSTVISKPDEFIHRTEA